jgi:hypothetical protein
MNLAVQGYEPVRVRLGDVSVSDTRIQLPHGMYPLAGTTWMVTNQTYVTESIPAWAIVCAILFFIFCLLGLLFLLVKERRLYGSMQVSIQGPGLSHSTYIPVNSEIQIFQINNSVDWIRGQVARLSA